jgi:NAD(P)-dependent dehydrogenase (short-subunit alcohol dehydrogenase family)
MGDFSGKVVFITGAAHGQGRATALLLAKQGADIAAFDVAKKLEYPAYEFGTGAELESLREAVEALGRRAVIAAGDVRDDAAVSRAVRETIAAFGKIDILFNNAGICAYAAVDSMADDEWNAMIDINLKGPSM